jgi:tight adherence protein B
MILAIAAALALASIGLGFKNARATKQQIASQEAWPAFVDAFASTVSGGLSRAASLEVATARAPKNMRVKLQKFESALKRLRVADALNSLKSEFANAQVDEFVEVLKLNELLGGSGLVELLSAHAIRCRESNAAEAAARSKVAATLVVAKLAVGAPWVLLCLLLARPESAESFETPQGLGVLVGGLAVCDIAYRAVSLIGRRRADVRVYG